MVHPSLPDGQNTSLVNGCAVSPDGSYIVSASSDRTLKVWDALTGTERLTFSGHTDSVNGCAVTLPRFGGVLRGEN